MSHTIHDRQPDPPKGVDKARARDLVAIDKACVDAVILSAPRAVVARGDSLDLLRAIPASSISLIVTDPPYHSTRKDNIYGDKAFAEDHEYIAWMQKFGVEWRRVLRPNGALYVFCAPIMSAQLEVMLSAFLRPLNHVTWTKPNEPGYDGWKGKMAKEALRRWYPHSERILFFEQATEGTGRQSTLGQLLRERRIASGMSGHRLTQLTGEFGVINHGGAISNWETGRNIPSREQYQKVVEALEGTGRIAPMPAYEDVVRPFNMNGDLAFTDVWDFPSVRPYKGKHPAEKPLDMLQHIISASTYAGDVVLDCFSGSGATAVAALNAGRRVVAIDIEPHWAERTAERVSAAAPNDARTASARRRSDIDPQYAETESA